jgi:hypothetical protein
MDTSQRDLFAPQSQAREEVIAHDKQSNGEPGCFGRDVEPPQARYDDVGRFIHLCHCGAWGAFGYGVRLRHDELGTWYCREHRPRTTSTEHKNDHMGL